MLNAKRLVTFLFLGMNGKRPPKRNTWCRTQYRSSVRGPPCSHKQSAVVHPLHSAPRQCATWPSSASRGSGCLQYEADPRTPSVLTWWCAGLSTAAYWVFTSGICTYCCVLLALKTQKKKTAHRPLGVRCSLFVSFVVKMGHHAQHVERNIVKTDTQKNMSKDSSSFYFVPSLLPVGLFFLVFLPQFPLLPRPPPHVKKINKKKWLFRQTVYVWFVFVNRTHEKRRKSSRALESIQENNNTAKKQIYIYIYRLEVFFLSVAC